MLRDAAKLQYEAENRWRKKHPDEAAAHDAELASEEAAVENDARDAGQAARGGRPRG